MAEVKSALQEAEDKYRILVENANDAIFVLQDGKIKFANPKALEIAEVLAEELEKTNYTEYLHPEEKATIVERHEKRLKGEKILHMYPLRIVSRQGTVVWTEVNAVLIEWEKQPATARVLHLPSVLNFSISQIVSIVSSLASRIKAHVFTTMISAREKSQVFRNP